MDDRSRYELGEALGRGSMGEVRDAVDRQIGRRVAIKTIRSAAPSERAITRFLREARIQGRLEHPAIPAVHELGRDSQGRPFFVMKKLSGTTLSKLLKAKGARPTHQRLLRAFADVCLAVEFAHVHGVIHRDIKPENIVLGDFGEVYVLDWGVAKVVGEDDTFDDISEDGLETRAGAVFGTLGYMAPEQGRGEPDIDARADVYALGIVLREILDADADAVAAPELRMLAERANAPRCEDRPDARTLADGVQRYLDGDRDLSLRRDLAREHLRLATEAFARGERSTAMREAGRAIALDPQLADAGDLISRLMLEPPTETPPEVVRELQQDAAHRRRASARSSVWGFLAFVPFLPNIVIRGGGWGYALLVAAAVSFIVVLVAAIRARGLSPWWVALTFVPILFILAHLFTPPLVAPGIAAVVASALATNPMLGSRQASVALWALMSVSVLGAVAAEGFGWITRT
ncbi:MAG: protein kinase, partial [Deltaproteobacteria bacterium]|nr:protein kinase [Deltaproteobacteria bacterium]